MKVKKIKIAHIHVWDKKNKGDVSIVLSVQDLLKDNFGKLKIIDLPIETLKYLDKEKIKKINSSDLLIIGGGGIFYHYFTPFNKKVIEAIKIPIIIFGVGYIREVGARRLKDKEIKSIIQLNKKASLIGVRDYYTKNFLIKHGLPKNKIYLIGDPAILLKEKKPKNLKLSSRVKIGLNLNYSGWLGFGQWRQDILKAYRETAEYFIKNHKAQIYYLVHHPDEANIYPELKIPNLKIINLEPAEQKYFYSQLDLVIGMMLHSCVMAFGAGTPEINVAYDIRNKSFAKFISCPELVISLPDLKSGKLLKTAKKVFKNQATYRKKFALKKESIIKKHNLFLDKIKKLK